MRRLAKRNAEEADVDVTSFINLVIVLVPVLLMGMVLSKITVLDLKLPDISTNSTVSQDNSPAQLELIVRENYFDINYPAGIRWARIEKTLANQYDYPKLTLHLQELKRQLREKNIVKRDIYLLSEKNIDYQSLVKVMDVVRSYRAVVVTSVVNTELFPDVSLGDAPLEIEQTPSTALDAGDQP